MATRLARSASISGSRSGAGAAAQLSSSLACLAGLALA